MKLVCPGLRISTFPTIGKPIEPASPVSTASFYLPLACVIDPKTTNAWLARRTGLCTAATFEDFLQEALRSYLPQPSNLISQQVIHDDHYQVTGHIWSLLSRATAQQGLMLLNVSRPHDTAKKRRMT